MRVVVNLILSLFLISNAYALERCNEYIPDVRSFHRQYFGLNFPYYYSVAQLEKESACRHHILSSDREGSEGLAQITYKVWRQQLIKEGIQEIKTIPNHLKAQAYINRYYYNYAAPCDYKLWSVYQAYNGGFLVFKECSRSNSSNWSDARKVCSRKNVCVKYKNNKCIQYRNACDINYEYSKKIYNMSDKYKLLGDVSETEYRFW